MTLEIFHLDDDIVMIDRFRKMIQSHNQIAGNQCSIESFDEPDGFLKRIAKSKANILLVDVHLEGQSVNGVDIVSTARTMHPNSIILAVSSTKDTKTIRACLKAGADDFVSKDVTSGELLIRIETLYEERSLNTSNLAANSLNDHYVGATLTSIRQRVPAIVKSAINCVYIEGESGTGKEVAASIFADCLPKGTPFVRLNCGSIAPSLLASELFGHIKGSFTGALSDKIGLLESAGGGWIFLDEVATLPTDAQISLLRAIDNQTIRRVGSPTEKSVSFRVISATNEPLKELVAQGKFRNDLWQRLRETEILIPPLRERKTELKPLIKHFLSNMRGGPYTLAPTVQDTLESYDWSQGNVRELRNTLRAMTEKAIGGLLTAKSIPEHIWNALEANKGPLKATTSAAKVISDSIEINWQKDRPSYDDLCQLLLLELLKLEFRQTGLLSLRTLGKSLGMAKSTISLKIKSLTESNQLSKEDISKMFRSSAFKSDDSDDV